MFQCEIAITTGKPQQSKRNFGIEKVWVPWGPLSLGLAMLLTLKVLLLIRLACLN